MAERSNIEWCDATFNPWIGCTKVSPACDHCYAEAWDRRFAVSGHAMHWGAGQARKRTSAANWRLPMRWNAKACWFVQCNDCGWRGESQGAVCERCHGTDTIPARRRVFCASLADVFDNEVPVEWRRDLLELIAATPNLDWILLTKRVGNVMDMVNEIADRPRLGSHAGDLMAHQWRKGNPPRNVWLGATICNQSEADRDIPKLLATPAAVRFISVEPMLGPIDLWSMTTTDGATYNALSAWAEPGTDPLERRVDWVICGGESGPHARPMHPEWARDLRDQCAAAGVPFLFKQWGEFGPTPDDWKRLSNGGLAFPEDSIFAGMPSRQIHRNFDDYATSSDTTAEQMRRVGKKAAGRLLEGIEHNGFPEVRT
jgi:protein gp37